MDAISTAETLDNIYYFKLFHDKNQQIATKGLHDSSVQAAPTKLERKAQTKKGKTIRTPYCRHQ